MAYRVTNVMWPTMVRVQCGLPSSECNVAYRVENVMCHAYAVGSSAKCLVCFQGQYQWYNNEELTSLPHIILDEFYYLPHQSVDIV